MATWFKLDNAFSDHPKLLRAGPHAAHLYVVGLAWCSRNVTDGVIPKVQIVRLVNWIGCADYDPAGEIDKVVEGTPVSANDLAEQLVRTNLWIEHEDHYEVHDYLDWQQSAEEITERIERCSVAGKRSGESRRNQTRTKREPNVEPNANQTRTKPRTDTDTDTDTDLKPKPLLSSKLDGEGLSKQAKELFEYWKMVCGHPKARFTRDRKAKVLARLKDGYSVEEIRTAIEGARAKPFVNDKGVVFDDLALICRNGEKLEGFKGRGASRQKAEDPWDE